MVREIVAVEKAAVLSDRVKRLRERYMESRPQLSAERAYCFLESYKETEGQPAVIRRAKVLEKYVSTMEIEIDENPIVGGLAKGAIGFPVHPEHACEWMLNERESLTSRGFGKEAIISEKDWNIIEKVVGYWRDKSIEFRTNQLWYQETGLNYHDFCDEAGVLIGEASIPKVRLAADYGKVLNKGLEGVIKEAKDELEKLPISTMEALRKRHFLNAVIVSCNAVIILAKRYASLARDMARAEVDPKKRAELERIAETCEWVPAKPARSFYEAIQSFFFTHLGLYLDMNCAEGTSPGRFPLYMYPFYKKDKEAGRITEEEAIELLELLFLKLSALVRWVPRITHEWVSQSTFQNLNLGGVTREGRDATNELDYFLIEAQKRVRLLQPTLSLLYHDKLPDDLLLKAAELVRTGHGMPAFFSNDVNITRLLHYGASLEDAREGCMIGCVECGYSHASDTQAGGFVNSPKMLEFALNNGKDPLTGKQLGLKTGEAENFDSYEELHKAIRKQFQYAIALIHDYSVMTHALNVEYLPLPFASALVDDCIKRGEDMHAGGARYSVDGLSTSGMIDLCDSLAAVKKLVFEEKSITMTELLEALRVNFEGYEEIHQKLLQAPKYGNDDDYVDSIVRDWYQIFDEEVEKYKNHIGRQFRPLAVTVTSHVLFGTRTGALPSGRKAKTPMADATLSPFPGSDRNGPTAVVKSATSVIDNVKYIASQLNVKFHPSSLAGKEGLKKLTALIKTYMDLGGHHIQFNVVSADTLRDAQLHPENYRDLVVRVVGFSAFFINLDPVLQGEIIKRTEHEL